MSLYPPLSRSFFSPYQTHPDKEQLCPAAMAFHNTTQDCNILTRPGHFLRVKMKRFTATSEFRREQTDEFDVCIKAILCLPPYIYNAYELGTSWGWLLLLSCVFLVVLCTLEVIFWWVGCCLEALNATQIESNFDLCAVQPWGMKFGQRYLSLYVLEVIWSTLFCYLFWLILLEWVNAVQIIHL